jgi:arsenate reductase (thioredoxin)
MDRVIFACVHNAGRSQMAAAFFNQLVDRTRAEAVSAGTQPGERVHPVVIDVLNEVGINLSGRKPQLLTESLASDANLLVTMGCGDECPVVPGLKREDWPLQDPKDQPIEVVRQIRDDIKSRVTALVTSRGWSRHSEGDS